MNKASPRDYSLIAPVYDHIFHLPLAEGHRALGTFIKKEARGRHLKVLEVGVGSGLLLDHLPQKIDYTGVDINKRMLSFAHKRIEQTRRRNLRLDLMDARKLRFKDNSFDLVAASSVISAMDAPEKAFREMVRVTRRGGHIALIANLRTNDSLKSKLVGLCDPLTRKYLGFRTDLTLDLFAKVKNAELMEVRPVNKLAGMPLSSYLVFRKK